MLTGTSAGLLQLMHPGLGAGVAEHSAFFEDPWGRILRSIPQIWATIFADEEEGASRGRAIRDIHRHIKGVDDRGRPYHALDPEVFWWAHATFTWEFLRAAELYHPRPPSRAAQQELYDETVVWYQRYGVSDRCVPPDLDAFERTFRQICAEVLEPTMPAMRAVEMAQAAKAPELVLEGVPSVLHVVAPLILWPTGHALRLMTLGALPGVVRRRFDITWTRLDRLRFGALVRAVREGGRVMPRRAFSALIPPGTPTAFAA